MNLNYFILSQDIRVVDAVVPIGVSKVIRPEMLVHTERLSQLEGMNLQFPIQDTSRVEYVDYISRPVPLISEKLKKLVELFMPQMDYYSVFLTDNKRTHIEGYWLIVPPMVECLSTQSTLHMDGTLRQLVIDPTKVGGYPMFQVAGIREKVLLINLALAESIMRREFLGIGLTKVEMNNEIGSDECARG